VTEFEAVGVLEGASHPPSEKSAARATIPARRRSGKRKDEVLDELLANRKLACTGSLLGKKSRLSGPILSVAKVAQADANQAKPLVRAEADTITQ
jgi:hypothetical protein